MEYIDRIREQLGRIEVKLPISIRFDITYYCCKLILNNYPNDPYIKEHSHLLADIMSMAEDYKLHDKIPTLKEFSRITNEYLYSKLSHTSRSTVFGFLMEILNSIMNKRILSSFFQFPYLVDGFYAFFSYYIFYSGDGINHLYDHYITNSHIDDLSQKFREEIGKLSQLEILIYGIQL